MRRRDILAGAGSLATGAALSFPAPAIAQGNLLHREGLIMAPPKPKKRGVWQNSKMGAGGDDDLVDRVADFSYESDALAQLIVQVWLGQHTNLLSGTAAARSAAAKAILATKGLYLEQPIVIKETEYDAGFSLADNSLPSAVVFVVPDVSRATTTHLPPALLETAKMLMAVTPNGI